MKPTNISVGVYGGTAFFARFEAAGYRHHFNVSLATGKPLDAFIRRNPPAGVKVGGEGWFPTRKLAMDKHRACVDEVLAYIAAHDLVGKATAAAAEAEREANAQDRQRRAGAVRAALLAFANRTDLQGHPDARAALRQAAGALTDDQMRELARDLAAAFD
jgi:hypothetical protein